MAGVPFKVSIPGMSRSGLQVGIVANSLKHLGQILEERLGLSEHAQIYLDDGTLVCDQEYFELLEPQTKLTVVEGRDDLQGRPLRQINKKVNVSYTNIVCTSIMFVFSAVAKILHVPMNGLCIESLWFVYITGSELPLVVGSSSDLVVLRRWTNSGHGEHKKNPSSRKGLFSVIG